jgi:cyclopropane-fatty-acyl-phospholipid synthase
LARLKAALSRTSSSGVLHLADGSSTTIGQGPPLWEWTIHDDGALARLTQLGIGADFIAGTHSMKGDLAKLMAVRTHLPIGLTPRVLWGLAAQVATGSSRDADRRAVEWHYSMPEELFLLFLDQKYRLYSHGLFSTETTSLEEASETKLSQVFTMLELKPGMRVLDVGSGWGGFRQYCNDRGVAVTCLTLGSQSFNYLTNLDVTIPDQDTILTNFLDYHAPEPFDAVVVLGVLEHIPDYAAFFRKVREVLRPGGRLYADASASVRRLSVSPFTRKHTWQGGHTFICLPDVIRELLWHDFTVENIADETRDYALTMRSWADRLEAEEMAISTRWQAQMFRTMRLYLRGGEQAMSSRRLQAYHVVAVRGNSPACSPRRERMLDDSLSLVQRTVARAFRHR